MISVSDTGIGMSPDVAERAFDPFFTTKPIGLGTGLGLSMIYGFAKQSRGHVRIYSEEGRGTTIRLYLARAFTDVDIPSIIETVQPARGEGENDPGCRGRRSGALTGHCGAGGTRVQLS